MNREAYWIEKALHRAKITPDRGGEILFHAFQNLKEEALKEAEAITTALQADNERLREALGDLIEDHAEGCGCRHHQALNPPAEVIPPEATVSAEVIPLRKENT